MERERQQNGSLVRGYPRHVERGSHVAGGPDGRERGWTCSSIAAGSGLFGCSCIRGLFMGHVRPPALGSGCFAHGSEKARAHARALVQITGRSHIRYNPGMWSAQPPDACPEPSFLQTVAHTGRAPAAAAAAATRVSSRRSRGHVRPAYDRTSQLQTGILKQGNIPCFT